MVLLSFDILKSKISILFSEDQSSNLMELTKSYPIDIDFSVKKQVDKNIFAILLSISINENENPEPGYSISVEGAGIFNFSEELDEIHQQQFIHSAVNICITNLRSYINSATAFFPIGRFSFNVIDMAALLKSKKAEE